MMYFIWIVLTFILFNIAIMRGFIIYGLNSMGHKSPIYVFDKLSDTYLKPKRFSTPMTWLMFKMHNIYNRLMAGIHLSWLSRMIRFMALYMWIYYIGYVFILLYVIITAYLIIYKDASLYLLSGMILALYVLLERPIKNESYRKSNIYHYIMMSEDAVKWMRKIPGDLPPHQFEIEIAKDSRHLSNAEDIIDQSILTKNEFLEYVLDQDLAFHWFVGIGIGTKVNTDTTYNGGLSYFDKPSSIKINNVYMRRNNGMLTILDGYDLVPKGASLRDIDNAEAYKLRWQSKVAGMNKESGKYLDRTHLVHHRLSNAEGGWGVLIPVFKSVNTGLWNNYGEKILDTPHKNSMKYYEDKIIKYLESHPKHKIMYYAKPIYNEHAIIPTAIEIQCWRVDLGNIYPLFKAMVYNDPKMIDRSFDVEIDMKSGIVY